MPTSRQKAVPKSRMAMEARSVDAIPRGTEWQYEPKWDGFRCLMSRRGRTVELRSKSGEDLGRYFPELIAAAVALKATSFLLDGEIVMPHGKTFSFDNLLQRIHPAASRVEKLSQETPALFVVFDLLQTGADGKLSAKPLSLRRPALEAFAKSQFKPGQTFRMSPATMDYALARKWLARSGDGFDGVIAKRLDLPYQAGNRDGMQKIKKFRSADCVIGGFRYATNRVGDRKVVGSLLLGVYDDKGLLHHVGFTSAIKQQEKPAAHRKARAADRRARLHRQCAGWTEPMVDRSFRAMVSAQAEARHRGVLRPFQRRALPARHVDPALASRQGAAPMHLRAIEAAGRRSHEDAE